MRVTPRASIAVVVIVVYAAIMAVIWTLMGTDYETVGTTTETVFRGIVVPVGAAAVFVAATTTYLRWWRPVLRDTPTGPRWLLILPITVFLTSLGTLLSKGFDGIEAQFLLTLALGTLFVGFGEEIAARGIGVVALRGSTGEVGVWFFTSLLFGALHSINVLYGQSLTETAVQIVFASLLGSVLYVIRRVTGTLVVCILLHAFWDFATFTADASTGDANAFAALALFQYVAIIVGIWGLVLVLRRVRADLTRQSA